MVTNIPVPVSQQRQREDFLNMAQEYTIPPIKVPRFEEAAGFYTTKQRSGIMAKIRGKDTSPELAFRRALYARGVRFRVHNKSLPGKPDLSNVSRKFAVFIDGEFWHGHNWEEKKGKLKSNRGFWIPKIERNMQRDAEITQALQAMGFKVFRFWDFQVKGDLEGCVQEVGRYLKI
jgi:DNA mismatch endonuclease, patch repair protein